MVDGEYKNRFTGLIPWLSQTLGINASQKRVRRTAGVTEAQEWSRHLVRKTINKVTAALGGFYFLSAFTLDVYIMFRASGSTPPLGNLARSLACDLLGAAIFGGLFCIWLRSSYSLYCLCWRAFNSLVKQPARPDLHRAWMRVWANATATFTTRGLVTFAVTGLAALALLSVGIALNWSGRRHLLVLFGFFLVALSALAYKATSSVAGFLERSKYSKKSIAGILLREYAISYATLVPSALAASMVVFVAPLFAWVYFARTAHWRYSGYLSIEDFPRHVARITQAPLATYWEQMGSPMVGSCLLPVFAQGTIAVLICGLFLPMIGLLLTRHQMHIVIAVIFAVLATTTTAAWTSSPGSEIVISLYVGLIMGVLSVFVSGLGERITARTRSKPANEAGTAKITEIEVEQVDEPNK